MGVVSGAKAALSAVCYDDAVLDHALVLECVEGDVLEGMQVMLSKKLMTQIGGEVMATIGELHRAGVAHGDAYPHNILVCGLGEDRGDWTKLVDLSCAKFKDGMGELEWAIETGRDLRALRNIFGYVEYDRRERANTSMVDASAPDTRDPPGHQNMALPSIAEDLTSPTALDGEEETVNGGDGGDAPVRDRESSETSP